MNKNLDFSIVIPIFNESENIILLLNEINACLKTFNYEIILIDDCSEDNTVHKLKNYKENNIFLIKNSNNLGQSKSIFNGVKAANSINIVTLDGDGQNDPADIPKLYKVFKKNNAGLVSGLRLQRKDNFIKKISSKAANTFRSFILNDDCIDTGCGLKIFNKFFFLNISFFESIHRFLPALFKGYGYKVMFVSVNHRYRKYGKSKYGIINRFFLGLFDTARVYVIINFKKK
jgi:dolichol-phosphate mannosyltransferase